jgi:hypothetical protein
MQTVDIICLANSRKHSGRCIAGLRADGKGWLRPVVETGDGALFPQHFALADGTVPQPLDLLRISVERARPNVYHPEDWILADTPWKLLKRPIGPPGMDWLGAKLARGPLLFGTFADHIPLERIKEKPLAQSLALIAPTQVRWLIQTGQRGNRKTRAKFLLDGWRYELSVSDPAWEQRLALLPLGEHPMESAGVEADQRLLFTVSLTEPFEGSCYKLVAAVIVPPTPSAGGGADAGGG